LIGECLTVAKSVR